MTPKKPTYEELVEAIKDAYRECSIEYMSCPWCSGHIGYKNTKHDKWCITKRIMKKSEWEKLVP